MKIDLIIGGETIPLHFGMVALEEMQKLVTSYMGTNKFAADVVWSGYLNQCAIQAIVPTMAYGDIMQKLEDQYFKDSEQVSESNLNEVLSAFEKSKAGSKLFETVDALIDVVAEGNEDLKKKKVVNLSTTSKK